MSDQIILACATVLAGLFFVCIFAAWLTDRPRLKPMSKQELNDLASKVPPNPNRPGAAGGP